MTANNPVLVTGCSGGIGEAVAHELLRRGHTVYATARDPATLDELAAAGARALALDVTDESSMSAAVQAIEAEHGNVGTLINNAGYGEYGAIEEVPLEAIRRQFETNVFGLARLVQLVLPGMRRAKSGRIVNVSSMGGRITFPSGGYYHASKFAVEAISDALRVEVAQFGVDVVVIEPGMIRTGFDGRATATLSDNASTQRSPYEALTRSVGASMASGYAGPLATSPQRVARVIRRAVEARQPRSRYVVTPAARAMITVRRFGGDRAWDLFVRQQFGVPGKPSGRPSASS